MNFFFKFVSFFRSTLCLPFDLRTVFEIVSGAFIPLRGVSEEINNLKSLDFNGMNTCFFQNRRWSERVFRIRIKLMFDVESREKKNERFLKDLRARLSNVVVS